MSLFRDFNIIEKNKYAWLSIGMIKFAFENWIIYLLLVYQYFIYLSMGIPSYRQVKIKSFDLVLNWIISKIMSVVSWIDIDLFDQIYHISVGHERMWINTLQWIIRRFDGEGEMWEVVLFKKNILMSVINLFGAPVETEEIVCCVNFIFRGHGEKDTMIYKKLENNARFYWTTP